MKYPFRSKYLCHSAVALSSLLLCSQLLAQAPQIQIEGAPEALEDNIRAHLTIAEERCDSLQRHLNRLRPQVRQQIVRAAQALGYYQLQTELTFTAAEPCWSLEIVLDPGEQVRFGEVNVLIPTDQSAVFQEAIANIPVRSGAPLDHSQYERLKSLLGSAAVDNGYFSARFNRSELRVDLQRNLADVNLEFDPGERFSFGRMQISAMDALSENFISRFIPFSPGEPYSTDQLIALRETFNASQYFDQVAVTPQLQLAQNQQIPVTIELTPRARRIYSAGAGVSTDSGPRVKAAYEDRYLNRNGHRLNADATASQLRQEINVSYIIPLQNPAHDSLRLNVGLIGEDTDTFERDTYRLGLSWRTRLGENWVQNIFTNLQREDFTVEARPQKSTLTISGINLARTRSDDPIFPNNGWRVFAQVSGASASLFSDLSFIQFYGSAKFIHSFGPLRLLLRGEAATTVADELDELPASQRFFAGGDQSIRGYDFGALGSLNADGQVIGGKHLLVGSAEIDFQLRPRWRAAVFFDRGNAFASFNDMNLVQSVGAGLRWLSPIGPIRLDLARALDDNSFRVHITMGPDL
ncbi:MAG: autotransporter assembly complex family protein [Pseudomonadales bacterium]|nr:autotransporter assembly complex family protein [Pseudomonadales bacterium]